MMKFLKGNALGVVGLVGVALLAMVIQSTRPWTTVELELKADLPPVLAGLVSASMAKPDGQRPAGSGTRPQPDGTQAARDTSGKGKRGGDNGPRVVSVVTARAAMKAIPIEYSSIGSVQAEATVVVRPRIDGSVVDVKVRDGGDVSAGDVLVTLDASSLDAQIEQARANAARSKAQIDKASRDLARAKQLMAASAGTKVTVEEAETALAAAVAGQKADAQAVTVLEVTRGYYTLKAPITGRVGLVSAQPGALVRSADALMTIVSFDPVYVNLGLPQRFLADLTDAMHAGTARLVVTVPGRDTELDGAISVIDNSVDPNTGLIGVRARIDNGKALLWPGQFVEARLIFRIDEKAVTIPNEAVIAGQAGMSVFLVDAQGKARQQPIVVARVRGGDTVVASGIAIGDQVVIDGRLQLIDGAQTREAGTAGEATNVDPAKGATDSAGKAGG